MKIREMLVPAPEAPCKTCVENAEHLDEQFGLVYCYHNRFGGVYIVNSGQWQIVGPYSSEKDFKRSVYNNMARRLSASQ